MSKKCYIVPKNSQPRNLQEARILSMLSEASAMTDERWSGEWINIHSDRLQREVGRGYSEALRALAIRKVIQCNRHWLEGGYPISYRLTDGYRTDDYDIYRTNRGNPPGPRIAIEVDDWIGIKLAEVFDKVVLPTDLVVTGRVAMTAERIRMGQVYATRCKYGRFHSSFTGLSGEYRAGIRTIDGSPLIDIDVSSCQPLLVWAMASEKAKCKPDFSPQYRELCETGMLYRRYASKPAACTIRATCGWRIGGLGRVQDDAVSSSAWMWCRHGWFGFEVVV